MGAIFLGLKKGTLTCKVQSSPLLLIKASAGPVAGLDDDGGNLRGPKGGNTDLQRAGFPP